MTTKTFIDRIMLCNSRLHGAIGSHPRIYFFPWRSLGALFLVSTSLGILHAMQFSALYRDATEVRIAHVGSFVKRIILDALYCHNSAAQTVILRILETRVMLLYLEPIFNPNMLRSTKNINRFCVLLNTVAWPPQQNRKNWKHCLLDETRRVSRVNQSRTLLFNIDGLSHRRARRTECYTTYDYITKTNCRDLQVW